MCRVRTICYTLEPCKLLVKQRKWMLVKKKRIRGRMKWKREKGKPRYYSGAVFICCQADKKTLSTSCTWKKDILLVVSLHFNSTFYSAGAKIIAKICCSGVIWATGCTSFHILKKKKTKVNTPRYARFTNCHVARFCRLYRI